MADPFGFLSFPREDAPHRPSEECLRDFRETRLPMKPGRLVRQAGRCLNCGVPFCELEGCPAGNRIPDWIAMAGEGKWETALRLLHSTNNFPEFTGRLCAAPCERSCILSLHFQPVVIRDIEREIADRGWAEGWIGPEPPPFRSEMRAAVIGSGPAGLAAAQELTRSGHTVTVFDREDRIGGILRYGIPDFALDKRILDRRIDQLIGEGVVFETGVDAGVDISIGYLKRTFDVVVMLTGARNSSDLDIQGRGLRGIVSAMDFLARRNRLNAGDADTDGVALDASGKRVVIVGGGETGAYCVGTCRRMGAREIVVLDQILPEGPDDPDKEFLRTRPAAASIDPLSEDCTRHRMTAVERFIGKKGKVTGVFVAGTGNSETVVFDADLVIVALGFGGAGEGAIIRNLSLETDGRGNLMVDSRFMTSTEGVFAAGDCVLGGSSVVDAIAQGRKVAAAVDAYLAES